MALRNVVQCLLMPTIDHSFLKAALTGYEHRLAAINVQIALLRASIGQTSL
jgi:hypothetical protein